MSTAACGFRGGAPAEAITISSAAPNALGGPNESKAPIPEIWASGVFLPAGNRSGVADGERGWIVTQPFQDDRLLLTKLTLSEGKATTIELEKHVAAYSGAGLAPDGAGHLWITYGDQALRIDESMGSIERWALSGGKDAASDSWSAGNAQAAAWDNRDQSLLFVRNDDHQLYRLSPADGAVTTVRDLGVYTTYLSSLVISDDGSMAVTGTAAKGAYVPAAVRVTSDKSVLIPDASSLCLSDSELVVLGRDGGISRLESDQASLVARVATLHGTSNPFACRGGKVFDAFEGDGEITVNQISLDGSSAQISLPLIDVGGSVHTYEGAEAEHVWAGAGVEVLIPDQQGGVWLVMLAGTQDLVGVGVSYPSLFYVAFGS